jgi:hypothetical protein
MKDTDRAVTGESTMSRVERVADIPDQFVLVQDSQDVHAVLESCGLLTYESETGCLFVEVLDGEYGSVYMSTRYVPILTARVYQLQ